MASRFIAPLFDVGSGIKPSSGALLYFYEVGTVDPKDTYTDEAATIPSTNPVVSDSTGVFDAIWLVGDYDAVLKDKNLVQQWGPEKVIEAGGALDVTYPYEFGTVAEMAASTIPFTVNKTLRTKGKITVDDGFGAEYLVTVGPSLAKGVVLQSGLVAQWQTKNIGIPSEDFATVEVSVYADGELIQNEDDNTLVLGDGATAGGNKHSFRSLQPERLQRVIAHRGFTGVVAENTIAGVTSAINQGVDVIETDMQVTSDGTVVCYHDDTLDAQTNGTGAVSANTFAIINGLSYDVLSGTALSTSRIPTFSALLNQCKLNNIECWPEIKKYRTIADIDLMLADIAAQNWQHKTSIIAGSRADIEAVRSSTVSLGATIKIMVVYVDQNTWEAEIDYLKTLGGQYDVLMFVTNAEGGGQSMVNSMRDKGVEPVAYSSIPAVGGDNGDSKGVANRMAEIGIFSLVCDQDVRNK